ncbi:MAG: ABC transporter permease [Thermoplasmata archaeon]|nr:ABC transporter permease [Thermoplasmata archaeon]
MRPFPLSGFLYEFRRALLSVPLIVLTVLIVLASFGVLATFAVNRTPPSTFLESSNLFYFAKGEYHFESYVYDTYGNPAPGVVFNFTVFKANTTGGPPGGPVANATGRTAANGLVDVPVALAESNYSVQYSAVGPNNQSVGCGGQFFSSATSITSPPPGEIRPFGCGSLSSVLSGTGYQASTLLQVFFLGPNGTAPPNYQVYWAGPFNISPSPAPLPESSMHLLGGLSVPHQTYALSVPSMGRDPPVGIPQIVQVELFTTGGQRVAMDANQSAGNFVRTPTNSEGVSVAFVFVGSIMAFLVPLMAVLAAYSVYGRDRLTGVLEGVLARPVSRLGLAVSRYLAVIAALCLAVAGAAAVLDALVAWVLGGFLPFTVMLLLFSALLVEIGAFTGLVFLLAHALRSSAGLVATAIGLWAFFAIGWFVLVPLLGVLSGAVFSPGYERTVVQLEFFNPVQFLSLVQALLLGSVSVIGPTTPLAPSDYGITYASVVGDGLVWVLAPLAALVHVVRHRD